MPTRDGVRADVALQMKAVEPIHVAQAGLVEGHHAGNPVGIDDALQRIATRPDVKNQEPVWLAQQHDWFYSSLISLDIDGKVERVLLRDMQRHPYKQIIMHLDFQRIPQGVEITVRVPLHFTNIENSPAGKSAEVTVTSELNDVEVVMLPRHLPEFIEVDLGSIKAGDTVHLSDVKLPEGVRLAHAISDEFNPAVAVARYGKGHVEDEAPAAEGEGEGE